MPKALLEQQTCSPARSRVRPFLRHLYGASMERQLICSRGGGKEGEESETGSFLLSLALSVIAGASLIEPLHCDRRSLPSCAAPVGERAGAGCGARGESSLPLRHRARPPASPCPPTMSRRMLGSRCVDVSGREEVKVQRGRERRGGGVSISLSLSAPLSSDQAKLSWCGELVVPA